MQAGKNGETHRESNEFMGVGSVPENQKEGGSKDAEIQGPVFLLQKTRGTGNGLERGANVKRQKPGRRRPVQDPEKQGQCE